MDDFLSDSDGEKAVDELISQANDSIILEQVAAINCAGFTDSLLPSHLENRFQKLKSFPSSSTKSLSFSHPPQNEPKKSDPSEEIDAKKCDEKLHTTCSTKCPKEKKNCKSDSDSRSLSFSPLNQNPSMKTEKKGDKKSPSSSSSSRDAFSSRSISPPVKSGCFLCSPKKASSRKKNKENRGLDWGMKMNDDQLLSDLSNFSMSSRTKMMKKAMEEEERICREAEKIVKWAKQASARMDISGFEDEVSDDENDDKFH